MDAQPDRDGYESSELWLRPVDPEQAEAHRLAGGDSSYWAWSPDWRQVAGASAGEILIWSVPDGSLLGSWEGGSYHLVPLSWSARGKYLAVQGYLLNGQGEGLFVISLGP